MSHEAVDFGDCTACNRYDRVIPDSRKKLCCSRAVFARKLRINEPTLEKWEQGRAKPNPQAAGRALLVRRYPDTLARRDEAAVGVESAIPMK